MLDMNGGMLWPINKKKEKKKKKKEMVEFYEH